MMANDKEEVIGKGDIRRYRGKDDPRYDVNIEKAYMRWFNDARYFTRFIVGDGLLLAPFMKVQNHIGLNSEYFPLMRNLAYIDSEDSLKDYQESPAQQYDFMIDNGTLCFVGDPLATLRLWCDNINIGGYIILYLPDEEMYLRGKEPNQSYHQHMRNSFTICRHAPQPYSYNIVDIMRDCADIAEPISIQKCDHGYRYDDSSDSDQEKYVFCESACEVILRRLLPQKATVKSNAKSKTKSKAKAKTKAKSKKS